MEPKMTPKTRESKSNENSKKIEPNKRKESGPKKRCTGIKKTKESISKKPKAGKLAIPTNVTIDPMRLVARPASYSAYKELLAGIKQSDASKRSSLTEDQEKQIRENVRLLSMGECLNDGLRNLGKITWCHKDPYIGFLLQEAEKLESLEEVFSYLVVTHPGNAVFLANNTSVLASASALRDMLYLLLISNRYDEAKTLVVKQNVCACKHARIRDLLRASDDERRIRFWEFLKKRENFTERSLPFPLVTKTEQDIKNETIYN